MKRKISSTRIENLLFWENDISYYGVSQMRHTISVLIENKSGALTRVAALFGARGYNIHSLNVAPTGEPSLSRMTIVTHGDDATVEQIVKQLDKLVDVLQVEDFGETDEQIERELVLLKIKLPEETSQLIEARSEIIQLSEIFRAHIVDVQTQNITLEITGHQVKLQKFISLLSRFNITEIRRTGRIAMKRD